MYVAVKGGEQAIEQAHRLLAEARRGDPETPEITLDQIDGQLALAVDRVMCEGALYDRELASLAIKQARGDLVEAVFLLRAFRTTLARFGASDPLDTASMTIRRRISATFKDVPGGQILGPTFDYSHRLLDFDLAGPRPASASPGSNGSPAIEREVEPAPRVPVPRVVDLLDREGLIQLEEPDADTAPVDDLTRDPLRFPASRALRLQNLARGDEGFLLSLGYSTQRGYGRNHPFAGEIRLGEVDVELVPAELGFPITIGSITVTECEMVNQFRGSATVPAQFTRGYGLAFGEAERKAMAMALVDRALRGRELGEEPSSPAQDEEFVLYHSDNVEASGFVQHLKLPHYVDFQSELVLVRTLRAQADAGPRANAGSPANAGSRE
jgi:alpha-D-ribose 1-methylphosphonate 5-triphosphate synthase subunit PhnI